MESKELRVTLYNISRIDCDSLMPTSGKIDDLVCFSPPKKKFVKNIEEKLTETINEKFVKSIEEDWNETMDEMEDMIDYEKRIEKNRLERMKILKELNLMDVKENFKEAIKVIKKCKPPKRPRVRINHASLKPVRKSKRLQNVKLNLSEEYLSGRMLEEAEKKITVEKRKLYEYSREEIPPVITFEDAIRVDYQYESFKQDVSITNSGSPSGLIEYDISTVKSLSLPEQNIAKMTPDRITALSLYPMSSPLLVAAGTKFGNLGIWNVENRTAPYVFKNHSEGTTNMMFSMYTPYQLISSSYDGTLRCGDLEKQTFNLLYDAKDSSCTYFDFLSSSTFLVAQKNGCVVVVDNRTESGKHGEKQHKCSDYALKCVNVHPVSTHYFVTSGIKGHVYVWDLRRLQKKPVADIQYHKRSVSSAFFSPVTGNSILTTSLDDTIAIFDSTHLSEDIKLNHHIKRNNWTGRWLSVFRAKWLPNTDDLFVVGSMDAVRKLEVYDCKQRHMQSLMHPNLGYICSLTAAHPSRAVIVGGNSSGKVNVFTPSI